MMEGNRPPPPTNGNEVLRLFSFSAFTFSAKIGRTLGNEERENAAHQSNGLDHRSVALLLPLLFSVAFDV